MLIRCPTCASGYDLPSALLCEGRVLRCAHCRDAWAHGSAFAKPAAARCDAHPKSIEIAAEARSGRRATDSPARRDAPPRRRARLRGGATAAALALVVGTIAGGMTAVAARDRVVAAFPPSAPAFAALGMPVNLRGLALDALRSSVETADGMSTLALEGRITNIRSESTAVPSLRIAVRDAQDRELYFWTAPAPKGRLAVGETVPFRSRLSAPPPEGRSLAVSFVEAPAAGNRHVTEAASIVR